jgi:hypothetical protein
MVGGAYLLGGCVSGLTRMVKGPTDPVSVPLVAVMVMSSVSPTSPALGVPLNRPVFVSKLAHAGSASIAKVTTPLLEDTVGWNK